MGYNIRWHMKAIRILAALAACISTLAAITGCSNTMPRASCTNGSVTMSPCSVSGDNNTQVHFKVAGTDKVKWSVLGGDPQAGPGTIDANGLYTPPSYLTADASVAHIQATDVNDPTASVEATIQITPGFLQPLSPENGALPANGTLQISGSLAEVGDGAIHWFLSSTADGKNILDPTYGTLSGEECSSGSTQYTSCKVTYTAPAKLPAATTSVYVIAEAKQGVSKTNMHLLLNAAGINSSAATNQMVQDGAVALGSSGSNNADFDLFTNIKNQQYIGDCCGGTLGSLVQDSDGNKYVLSNNHVLAQSDEATVGSTIVQPGLIDGNCTPFGENASIVRPIASLSGYVPLSSNVTNVDAAVARINPGAVDTNGNILQIGSVGNNGILASAPPAAGTGEAVTTSNVSSLMVVKSGRTTGLTCSNIEAVGVSVEVRYYRDCAETKFYLTKTYTNQLVIGGSSFSDSGDSGALILDSSNAQPVGLFYAGGTDKRGNGYGVANPIGDVLSELGSQAGLKTNFSIVGGSPHPVACLNYDTTMANMTSSEALEKNEWLRGRDAVSAAQDLVNRSNGILGVAIGKSADNPGEAAVLIYTDKTRTNVQVPQTVHGVRTVVIPTDSESVANDTVPRYLTVTHGLDLPAATLDVALQIKDNHSREILSDPAFFGVGVTQSYDNPNEAALLVFVDQKVTPKSLPATIGGLRVRYAFMDRLHVTRSKQEILPHPSNCSIRAMRR
jgi:hypothetical protein